ncbi:MAG: hypothetical protein R2857_04980 [Vampirovibrionales bacterium]
METMTIYWLFPPLDTCLGWSLSFTPCRYQGPRFGMAAPSRTRILATMAIIGAVQPCMPSVVVYPIQKGACAR